MGFYAGERPDALRVLGGNQSNAVSETWIGRHRLLGARWPSAFPPPASGSGRVEIAGGGFSAAPSTGALSTNEA